MSSKNVNDSSEEDMNETKPDADKQPAFEPKRVIHLSKPLADPGEKPSWLGSIFSRKPTSDETNMDQEEDGSMNLPNTYPEGEESEDISTHRDRTVPDFSDKKINPGLRLRALLAGGKNPPPRTPPVETEATTHPGPRFVFMYIAIGLSLLINAILVVTLVTMWGRINSLNTNMNNLLSGLYGNFSGMDNASINTTITLNTEVPINFTLPIQQNTDVVLTESLTISKAPFVLNSGGLSINAPASITLPAGTNLPVSLNVAVPVQVTIPLTLQVPVTIPISQTGLHQPLTGLQDTIRTYYCEIDKNAQYPDGVYLCKNHSNPTTTPVAP